MSAGDPLRWRFPRRRLATDALDQVRRQAWNDVRKLARQQGKGRPGRPRKDGTQAFGPRPGHERAKALKGARYALWKNPGTLSAYQGDRLAWIAKTDPRLHRAYLLKEGLRHVFAVKGEDGKEALDQWLIWARRCQIPAFIDLARKITKHRPAIEAALGGWCLLPRGGPPISMIVLGEWPWV